MSCISSMLTLHAALLGGFAALAHASSIWAPALRHEPLNVLEDDPTQNATFLFKTTAASTTFHGFEMYSKDTVAALNVPAACITSLRSTVDCGYYVQRFRAPAYRGTPDPTGNLSSICDSGCASSLKVWIDGVHRHCQGHNISNANPIWPGASMLQGVRETCQTDESGKKYCNAVMDKFKHVPGIKGMPKEELCSYCHVHRLKLMQSSPYSVYNDFYKSQLEFTYSQCGLHGPTQVRPREYNIPEKIVPVCASGKFLSTTGTNDTTSCSAISAKHRVSGASLWIANSDLFQNRRFNCSSIPAGVKLCLPYSCEQSATIAANDTCLTIEERNGVAFGTVRFYNTWVNADCSNLKPSIAQFGNRLCLSPESAGWKPPPPGNGTGGGNNNGGNGPSGGTAYTNHRVAPPENVTVAANTTLGCGGWYVTGDKKPLIGCPKICLAKGIDITLFMAVNPSLGTVPGGCSKQLVPKRAYCSGPTWWWNATDSGEAG